jgi:hypothetical protein
MGDLRLPHHRPRVVRRVDVLGLDEARPRLVLIRRGWVQAVCDTSPSTATEPAGNEADHRWAA